MASQQCDSEIRDLDITRLSEQISWLVALVLQLLAIASVSFWLVKTYRWQVAQGVHYANKLFLMNIGCLLQLNVQFGTMIYAEVYSLELPTQSLNEIQAFQERYDALWVLAVLMMLALISAASIQWQPKNDLMRSTYLFNLTFSLLDQLPLTVIISLIKRMEILVKAKFYGYLRYLNIIQKILLGVLCTSGILTMVLLFFKIDISFYVVSVCSFAIETIFVISCIRFWMDIEELYDLSSTFKNNIKASIFTLIVACIIRVIYNILGAAGLFKDAHCFNDTLKENTNFLGCLMSLIVFLFGSSLPVTLLSSIFSPHRGPKHTDTSHSNNSIIESFR